MCEADGHVKDYINYKSEAARRLEAIDKAHQRSKTGLDQLVDMGVDLSEVRLLETGERLGTNRVYSTGR